MEIQVDPAHTIGNLSLSGHNNKIGNMSFIKKRESVDDNQKPVGYKNGLFLNKVLVTKETSSVNDITDRTGMIISKIKSTFSFFDN